MRFTCKRNSKRNAISLTDETHILPAEGRKGGCGVVENWEKTLTKKRTRNIKNIKNSPGFRNKCCRHAPSQSDSIDFGIASSGTGIHFASKMSLKAERNVVEIRGHTRQKLSRTLSKQSSTHQVRKYACIYAPHGQTMGRSLEV